ncbi:hypothetical protein ASPZODRAFT_58681 [Penicilliopsis zonata CBS 506.65]|uniref:Uncharacterized protein n=1 Tax=Penicilliopsis zonata CBS 506.65 TaxID=1073090 RepID=A0A1L9SSA2_9EURO|nr:hypothetical protein ASPZODRAFT_58681 [Penicilliopsis zonata CBS 506.65]OJJ50092.1 hypothetical protein ASPZODRAFT_58681 [Penicilliopsis zonata CBS 506.65]
MQLPLNDVDLAAVLSLCCIADYAFFALPSRILKCVELFILGNLFQLLPQISWAKVVGIFLTLATSLLVGVGTFRLLIAAYVNRNLILLSNDKDLQKGREFLGKPFFYPCRISHARTFDQKYRFSYSYFLVGVPIGISGTIGSLLSIDTVRPEKSDRKPLLSNWCLFTIDQRHYLDRGNHPGGLEGKLHSWLEARGEDPQQWPYAYMISVPNFLWSTRNPATWWFLYSSEKQLTAMVMEANNSFGERKPVFYRLDPLGEIIEHPDPSNKPSTVSGFADGNLISLRMSHSKSRHKSYQGHWDRDLYISPFEDVGGHMATTCVDPCGPKWGIPGDLQLSATFHDPEGRPKIITRIHSWDTPVDLLATNGLGLVKFILGWGWVGTLSMPRIMYQALRIWLRGNVILHERPQVIRSNIPRRESQLER